MKHVTAFDGKIYFDFFDILFSNEFEKFKKINSAMKTCSENTCQNSGICSETSQGNYECLCREEYTGLRCECKK